MKTNADYRTKTLSLKPPPGKSEIEEDVFGEEALGYFTCFEELDKANGDCVGVFSIHELALFVSM